MALLSRGTWSVNEPATCSPLRYRQVDKARRALRKPHVSSSRGRAVSSRFKGLLELRAGRRVEICWNALLPPPDAEASLTFRVPVLWNWRVCWCEIWKRDRPRTLQREVPCTSQSSAFWLAYVTSALSVIKTAPVFDFDSNWIKLLQLAKLLLSSP